jgi:hypothetical protein
MLIGIIADSPVRYPTDRVDDRESRVGRIRAQASRHRVAVAVGAGGNTSSMMFLGWLEISLADKAVSRGS